MSDIKFYKNGQWNLDKGDKLPQLPIEQNKPTNLFTAKFSHSMPMHQEEIVRMTPKKKGAKDIKDFIPNSDGFEPSNARHHYFDIFHGGQKMGQYRVTTGHPPGQDEPQIGEYGSAHNLSIDHSGKKIRTPYSGGGSDLPSMNIYSKLDKLQEVDPKKFKYARNELYRALNEAHNAEAESDKGHIHYRDHEHLTPKKQSN